MFPDSTDGSISSSQPGFKWRRPLTREEISEQDPLGEFRVHWLDITRNQVDSFERVLAAAQDERDLQRYLAAQPGILAHVLDGGHGRWVIPQKRLGDRFVPDFVLGHRWSGPTWEWILVELQTPVLRTGRNPDGRLFTKQGRFVEQLDEGLRQINEWRRWLETNLDYARRARSEHGLGMTEIGANPPGLLLIGREDDLTPEHAARRKQLADQHDIRIHSYDWLARAGRRWLESPRR